MEASKWCKSDDRSTLLKHRSYFRTTFTGIREAGTNFGRQTALENEPPGPNGDPPRAIPRSSAAPPLRNLTASFSALESGGWGSQGRKSEHLA